MTPQNRTLDISSIYISLFFKYESQENANNEDFVTNVLSKTFLL